MAFMHLAHRLSSFPIVVPFNQQAPCRDKGKSSILSTTLRRRATLSFFSTLTKLECPPVGHEQNEEQPPPPRDQDKKQPPQKGKDDFYLNLGTVVRTLREDFPSLFFRDLNYDIYREDITFMDPLNTFHGIDNYRLIFWALRTHGRILFREISIEVLRIWQPCENVILIRWDLRGVPRVPWEAEGHFQGTSRYKLDRNGKIFEHKVDNLAFNFPQPLRSPATVLGLVSSWPASPNLSFLWGHSEVYTSTWLQLYRAVRETVDQKGYVHFNKGLAACS